MKVRIEKKYNGLAFEVEASIRDDIMKIQNTKKTAAFGVPEYLVKFYSGENFDTYGSADWNVRIAK